MCLIRFEIEVRLVWGLVVITAPYRSPLRAEGFAFPSSGLAT